MGLAKELCRALEECPRYLFGADLDRVTQWSCNFADLYIALAEECLAKNVLKYKLLRKIHPFFHMYEDASEDTKVLTPLKGPQFPGFPLVDSRGPGRSLLEMPPAPFRRGTSPVKNSGEPLGENQYGFAKHIFPNVFSRIIRRGWCFVKERPVEFPERVPGGKPGDWGLPRIVNPFV
jgi:hypothetical protein